MFDVRPIAYSFLFLRRLRYGPSKTHKFELQPGSPFYYYQINSNVIDLCSTNMFRRIMAHQLRASEGLKPGILQFRVDVITHNIPPIATVDQLHDTRVHNVPRNRAMHSADRGGVSYNGTLIHVYIKCNNIIQQMNRITRLCQLRR